MGDGPAVVTDYAWHPSLPIPRMLERARGALLDPSGGTGFEFLCEVVEQAGRRVGYENLFYLEVSEPGTPRASCDINLYRARLPVSTCRAWCERLSAHYGVAADALREAVEEARERPLGHVSMGLDRNGREFLTLYFGVGYIERTPPIGPRVKFY